MSTPDERRLFLDREPAVSSSRLQWLIQLRWWAICGITLAAILAAAGAYPGVAWPVLAGIAIAALVYNVLLYRSHREGGPEGTRAVLVQVLVDLAMLTAVLWAAGGVDTPFIAYYLFHVALVGVLAGPRATVAAAGAACLGAGFLALVRVVPALQIGAWDPRAPWDVLADAAAYLTAVVVVAYLVTHAVRDLHEREREIRRARNQTALEYQVLSTMLHQTEAGLEVVDVDGSVLFRNKRSEQLSVLADGKWKCPGDKRTCESDATGLCPMKAAQDHGESSRCRFAAAIDGEERVFEMTVYPLPGQGSTRFMTLYLDRTDATLDERRLVLAERLVSLGRVAQGVAHELNTPLATIRTLATDMRGALRTLDGEGGAKPNVSTLVADLDESANLIQDETRRLGRITQALLAGGDLVTARIDGDVPVSAVVERARALVFAGVRNGPEVRIAQDIGEHSAAADPDRLMQVLVNLLQNAFDAVRDHAGAGIHVRAEERDGFVEVVVEDEGHGIDAKMEAKLFEPFATTKPPGQGTGLGLYTSYMLAQAMGGTLTLANREGTRGTRAAIRVPSGKSKQATSLEAGTR